MQTSSRRTDVLIVGAGPSGMVLAGLLARQGLTVRIVERHFSRLRFPKAHVINPVTLDVCARAGFAVPVMVAAATPPEKDRYGRFRVSLTGEELAAIPFEQQPAAWTPRPRINLAQPRFESILEWKLQVLPTVDYVNGRWLEMRRDEDGITSTVDVGGEHRTYESRFVVGADGAASEVRRAVSIPTTAYGEERPRISVHLAADLSPWLAQAPAGIYWALDPEARGTFIAHDIADEWVYVFDAPGGEMPSGELIEDRVRRAIGADVPFVVLGVSPWVMACEVADRFHDGRVFLVGDAAHRLPPTGGLGMNTGIQDVENLAWKIAAVVAGWADEAILETYAAERQPVAVVNALQSHVNAASMDALYRAVAPAITGGSIDDLDVEQLARVLNDQWPHLNSPGLQFGYTYATSGDASPAGSYRPSAREGRRLPHTWTSVEGDCVAIVDRLRLDRFTLLVNGSAAQYGDLVTQTAMPVEVMDVVGAVGDDWLRLMALERPGSAVVVRPDTHIFGRCSAPTRASWSEIDRRLRAYVAGDLHRSSGEGGGRARRQGERAGSVTES